MRQSGAFLGFLKRVSTNEHGIAGHDRLALSVRSWSSCSIAAMRRLKSENLETEITSARIDRSALSLTDSDSAPAASLAIWSDAQWARIAIRPSAIAGAPAARLDGGPELGLAGPPVGRAPGHLVIARPQGHGSALRDRECELGFRLLAEFFGHSVDWHAVT